MLPVACGGKREFYYSAEPALLAEPAQNSFVVENEEQRLRIRLPEAQLERERQDSARSSARRSCSRGRKRSWMVLSSSSFLSLCSSSSSSPESSEVRSRRRLKHRKYQKNSRRHHTSSGSRKWRQVAYQQHGVNEKIGERMGPAKRAMKIVKTKKTRRRLEEGEELLSERQEWLAVAYANGVHVASDGEKH